ncbi:MAG: hypothetical protein ACTS68_01560 [Candidatus Hodgkinia cicadicola]
MGRLTQSMRSLLSLVIVQSSLSPLCNIRRNAVTLTVNISTFRTAINLLNIIAAHLEMFWRFG